MRRQCGEVGDEKAASWRRGERLGGKVDGKGSVSNAISLRYLACIDASLELSDAEVRRGKEPGMSAV